MNDLEIIEKKNHVSKLDSTLDFSISPEDSQAVYLKKLDAAAPSAQQLGDFSLTDHDGQVVVASTVAEKKDLAAKLDAQAIEEKIRQSKLEDAKLEDETEGELDLSVGLTPEEMKEKEVIQLKEKSAVKSDEQPWWQRDPTPYLEKVWRVMGGK